MSTTAIHALFVLFITNQDHQCALYNSQYMTTNLNQKLKYSELVTEG